MPATIETVMTDLSERSISARTRYRELCFALALGSADVPEADDLTAMLSRCDKSLENFRHDVATIQSRYEAAETLATECPAALLAAQDFAATVRAYLAENERLAEEFRVMMDARVRTFEYNIQVSRGRMQEVGRMRGGAEYVLTSTAAASAVEHAAKLRPENYDPFPGEETSTGSDGTLQDRSYIDGAR